MGRRAGKGRAAAQTEPGKDAAALREAAWRMMAADEAEPVNQKRSYAVKLSCRIPRDSTDRTCEHLRSRIALSILVDEQVVSALASAIQNLRETDDAAVSDLECAVRTQRIGILKQRAILGDAGMEV